MGSDCKQHWCHNLSQFGILPIWQKYTTLIWPNWREKNYGKNTTILVKLFSKIGKKGKEHCHKFWTSAFHQFGKNITTTRFQEFQPSGWGFQTHKLHLTNLMTHIYFPFEINFTYFEVPLKLYYYPGHGLSGPHISGWQWWDAYGGKVWGTFVSADPAYKTCLYPSTLMHVVFFLICYLLFGVYYLLLVIFVFKVLAGAAYKTWSYPSS